MSVTHAFSGLRPGRAGERPRVGFAGVGWIGFHRMKAIAETGLVELVAVCDPSASMAAQAAELGQGVERAASIEDLLQRDLDGVVIATPTALHAAQAVAALRRGAAVFCQKPLGRTQAEVRAVIDAARAAERLLAVDFSYRFTEGMRRIRDLIARGELGHVFAADLTFHNAYGPDKPWFYDPQLAGGGCVMDLGVHLVDLALWTLGFPRVSDVTSRLFGGGEPLGRAPERSEDYGVATLELETKALVRLSCSWRLHAGRDAEISAAFYGTHGGARLHNVNGSFFDFVAERYSGTSRETLAAPPDAWFGRAAVDWVERLARGERFDPEAERIAAVAEIVDRVYGR